MRLEDTHLIYGECKTRARHVARIRNMAHAHMVCNALLVGRACDLLVHVQSWAYARDGLLYTSWSMCSPTMWIMMSICTHLCTVCTRVLREGLDCAKITCLRERIYVVETIFLCEIAGSFLMRSIRTQMVNEAPWNSMWCYHHNGLNKICSIECPIATCINEPFVEVFKCVQPCVL